MKSHGGLVPKILDLSNFYEAAYKAMRLKRLRPDVLAFRLDPSDPIRTLYDDFICGNFRFGNYKFFKIFDPKERTICAASFRERIVHHALMNICGPIFDAKLSEHSYATRKGRGQYKCLEKARAILHRGEVALKLDMRKYFDSIDHEVLKSMLRRIFRERELLRWFDEIIDSYSSAPGKGLPIGNLTSQFFANHYLGVIDRLLEAHPHIKGFCRYMDDILIVTDTKPHARQILADARFAIADKLKLGLKCALILKVKQSVPFLGFRILPGRMYLAGKTKRRIRNHIKNYVHAYSTGEWTYPDYLRHIVAVEGTASHASDRAFMPSCHAMFQCRTVLEPAT